MPVSDFLKEYMLKNGYTKADISRMSNIPYTTIDGLFKKGDENTKLSTCRSREGAWIEIKPLVAGALTVGKSLP